MYSIYDADGYRGDAGSAVAIGEMEKVAKRLNLETMLDFLEEGFTIEVDKLIEDFESIDLDNIGEIEDYIQEVLDVVMECSDIVILSDDIV